ncbi:hypothetical protein HanPI659440_Chr10g0399371 [Helianthus annuus]|nr:hypothetical protein HanPI659440_Chr10g0399371 [Helianthus annuus]
MFALNQINHVSAQLNLQVRTNHNELPIEPVSRNLRVGTLAASVSHSDLKNMFEIHRCVSIIVLFVAELRVCVLEECGGCNEGEE